MADIITIKLPAVITLTNTNNPKGGKAIRFVPYRENFTTVIAAGDSVKLEATTAGQVLYYLAQKTDGLTVTQEAKA